MKSLAGKELRFNFVVNLLDGGFFGFAIGFASFVTIIPLFVNTMTDSAVLIGLIPAIHNVGWQLPQLLTAERVARQRRFKPMVIFLTIQERLPFLGLAAVAWFLPRIGLEAGLAFTFLLLIWQGLGSGITANAWQSMVAKIFPAELRGTFLGAQASAANALASVSAILAGFTLEHVEAPRSFAICFFLASGSMLISWFFLAMTREPERFVDPVALTRTPILKSVAKILKDDPNFAWFLAGRNLYAFGGLAFAFYSVFAVRYHGASAATIGIMTFVLLVIQILANPIMGWLGDRWSYRRVMQAGLIATIASALLAYWAPQAEWFYLVYIFTGIGNVGMWTIALAMTLEFGDESNRPSYIGISNTLVAPSSILGPFLGGWLADHSGYGSTFLFSAACGLATLLVFQWFIKDPKHMKQPIPNNAA